MSKYEGLSKVYDKLMEEEFDYEKWYLYLKSFFINDTKSIMELGSGSGLMTVHLAKDNFDVTAIDSSIDMLSLLENKIRNISKNVKCMLLDISSLHKINDFDAVLSVCDVINYITNEDDLKRVFEAVYINLKDDGVFLFDVVTKTKLKEMLGKNTYTYLSDEVSYIWYNDYRKDISYQDITFFILNENGSYDRFDETHIQKYYKNETLINLLKETGFKDIKVYNYLTYENAKEDDLRIQFIAYK